MTGGKTGDGRLERVLDGLLLVVTGQLCTHSVAVAGSLAPWCQWVASCHPSPYDWKSRANLLTYGTLELQLQPYIQHSLLLAVTVQPTKTHRAIGACSPGACWRGNFPVGGPQFYRAL